ncbi:MAG: class I SAM-dependent methyltransferase [Pseudomonadota bacterium]
MASPFTMNSFIGKKLLALVRQGNYAHAGEEEAIEMAMAVIKKDTNRLLLDAGCGRGGTAHYLQKHGWGQVTGIDIEPQSIEGARKDYPDVRFDIGDIASVKERYGARFDVITLFNVLYAIGDHDAALAALGSVARPDATLVVFDYVDPGSFHRHEILEGDQAFLPNPIGSNQIEPVLARAGWQAMDRRDITDSYISWYIALVERIVAHRQAMEELAGAEGFQVVHDRYSALLERLRTRELAGYIIYAKRP